MNETQTQMKYSFTFYRLVGDGRLMLASSSLQVIAASLKQYCDREDKDLVQLRVDNTPELRKLFDSQLSNMNFSLIELKEESTGPVVEVHLAYKRKGWTLGPCAENNWGRDGG